MEGAAGRLNRSTKLLYGVGSIAYGAKTQLMGLLLLFYNQLIGLPAQWVSLALAISVTIDAIWDPLIGQYSDNLRTRWGRRHPLMYASAIPLAITFVMLFNPPRDWSEPALFAYLLVMIMVVRLAISFYEIPSSALAPELAPDYHERTSLLSYRWLFGTVGAAAAAILAFAVFLKGTDAEPMGQLNVDGYLPYAITVAVVMLVSIVASTAGTHYCIPKLHQPAPRKIKLGELLGEVRETLSNWNFGVAVVAGIFSGMALGLMTGLYIYFATYFWELPSSDLLLLTMATLVASPVAAVLAPWLSKRWGKKRACMTLFFAAVAVNASPIAARLMGVMPANGTDLLVGLLLADRLFTGLLSTAGFIIVSSMFADIVEESQMKTGRRSEGLLMSADNLLQKIVTGLATILPGLVLAAIHFPAKARPGQVDQAILDQLALIYLPATVIMSLASVFTWKFYRIDAEAHALALASIRDAVAGAEAARETVGLDAAPPESGAPIAPPGLAPRPAQ
jgi:GPH family glycoside/pentoside/hexuronide:cation symporter